MTRLWLTYLSDCLDLIVSSLRADPTSEIWLTEQHRVRWYTTSSIDLWVSSSRSSPGSHPPIRNLGYDDYFFPWTQNAQHWFTRRHKQSSAVKHLISLWNYRLLWSSYRRCSAKRNQHKCHFHLAHTTNNICPLGDYLGENMSSYHHFTKLLLHKHVVDIEQHIIQSFFSFVFFSTSSFYEM